MSHITQQEMNILVPKKLKEIEKDENIKILYAVESGSRAWGFASPDSDYDVRFIYKRHRRDYLRLNGQRDVIELPIDDTWDVNGWDLDKTLRLLYCSNPTLFEWLGSPICYYDTDFKNKLAPLMKEYFSVKKGMCHYLGTAKKNIKVFLQGEEVIPKKYFYALRPVLACMWMYEKQTPPPVLFDELAKAVLPEYLKPSVSRLLDIKMNMPEKGVIKPIKEIDDFLDEAVIRFEEIAKDIPDERKSWDMLNEFFYEQTENDFC